MLSYEEPEAYAASHVDTRQGIKMTPKVPPQFDGQSSWFEYEDLIDGWLGITTLDADKHGPSLKKCPCRSSFVLQVDARQCPTPRSGSWPLSFQGHIETLLREGGKSCASLAIPSDVSHVQRPEWIRALDRAFWDRSEASPGIVVRPAWSLRFTGSRHRHSRQHSQMSNDYTTNSSLRERLK